jgi:hypothetical protein
MNQDLQQGYSVIKDPIVLGDTVIYILENTDSPTKSTKKYKSSQLTKQREYSRRYYRKNREKILAKQRKRYRRNKK